MSPSVARLLPRSQSLDPLAAHRPFCPWTRQGDGDEQRCGWRYGLEALTGATGVTGGDLALQEQGGAGDKATWDPAAVFKALLPKLDVAGVGTSARKL